MPRYDYRCRTCGETFEIARPMTSPAGDVTCPGGHTDTVKLLSTVALTGRGGVATAPLPSAGPAGGCCGGGCACGH